MDNNDDEKRRVMTPPAEWTGGVIKKAATKTSAADHALENIEDDTDWLESDFSSISADDIYTQSTAEDVASAADSWLALDGSLEDATEVVTPAVEEGDDWQADQIPVSRPEDPATEAQASSGTTPKQRDEDTDWVSASAPIHHAEQHSEQQMAGTEASAEQGSSSADHSATPVRNFPVWPALLLGAALVLLVIGSWGAMTEQSALNARIVELNQMNKRAKADGNLNAKAKAALEENNEAMRLQLVTLREQYAALTSQINSMQEPQADNIAVVSEPTTELSGDPGASAASSLSIAGNAAVATVIPTASGGPWFVNIGSYDDRDVAAESVQQFESMDYLLVIQAAEVNGRMYYRIRATDFATQDDAQAAAKQFETTFNMQPLWVGKAANRAN
tara:strand:- start:713 stop:1882 length:1170 start_codon:yes stop_codon:yes gene_type:complete